MPDGVATSATHSTIRN